MLCEAILIYLTDDARSPSHRVCDVGRLQKKTVRSVSTSFAIGKPYRTQPLRYNSRTLVGELT